MLLNVLWITTNGWAQSTISIRSAHCAQRACGATNGISPSFFPCWTASLNNVFCLFSKHHEGTPLGKCRRHQFYAKLCDDLLQVGGVIPNQVAQPGRTVNPSFSDLTDMSMRPRNLRLLTRGTPEYHERLKGASHFIRCSSATGNSKLCVLCTCAGAGKKGELKVSHYCKQR